jgi:hypothetical protein
LLDQKVYKKSRQNDASTQKPLPSARRFVWLALLVSILDSSQALKNKPD